MQISRRQLLAASGTAFAAGVAGCSGARDHNCDIEDPGEQTEAPRAYIGDPDSDIVARVYEDFGCPACKEFYLDSFPPIRQEYVDQGIIRWEHWDWPIPASNWSEEMASAGRGILDRHGSSAFFSFAKAVYQNQNDHSYKLIGDIAEEVGADRCRSIADAEFKTYEPVINADRAAGAEQGIGGTPTVTINAELITPDQIPTTSDISQAIETQRD